MRGSPRPASAPTAAAQAVRLLRRAGVLAVGALTLSGCATVVLGAREPFAIRSSPAGAHVSLSTGETCITPCQLELPRAVAFKARVSLPGYATQVIPVASRLGAGGAVGFLGNGVIGGVVGAGVDIDSGAMRALTPNPLRVRLIALPLQNSTQNP